MTFYLITDDKKLKTRFKMYNDMVRIDTLVFSDTPVSSISCDQRKWKDKWFIRATTFIPNGFVVCFLKEIYSNEELKKELSSWITKIIKENIRYNRESKKQP